MAVLSTFLNATAANQVVLAACAGALVYAVIIGRRVVAALRELFDLLESLNTHTDNLAARAGELQTDRDDNPTM